MTRSQDSPGAPSPIAGGSTTGSPPPGQQQVTPQSWHLPPGAAPGAAGLPAGAGAAPAAAAAPARERPLPPTGCVSAALLAHQAPRWHCRKERARRRICIDATSYAERLSPGELAGAPETKTRLRVLLARHSLLCQGRSPLSLHRMLETAQRGLHVQALGRSGSSKHGCKTQPGCVALGGADAPVRVRSLPQASRSSKPSAGTPSCLFTRRLRDAAASCACAGGLSTGDCDRPLRHPHLHPHWQAGGLLGSASQTRLLPAAASPAGWTPFGCVAARAASPAVPAAPAAKVVSLGRLAAAATLAGWTPFGRASSSGLSPASDLVGSAPVAKGLAGGPADTAHCTKPLVLLALGASGMHPQLKLWRLQATAPVYATLCVSPAAVAPSAAPNCSTLPAARAHAVLSCVNCHTTSTLHKGAGS